MRKVEIIAEIGVNHNGDVALAKEMIDSAYESGADIIKFQTFRADEVMTAETPLADYMIDQDSTSFLDLIKSLELANDVTLELKDYTESLGAEFLSSPFDVSSVFFLQRAGLKRLKIASGETVNPFVLKAAAHTGLDLIISTGMCSIDEVGRALEILKENGSGTVTAMHCTTQYPAEVSQSNLRALLHIEDEFGVPIGYSDHTPGIEVSLAAVALGSVVIEKHFTTDRSLPGPDQAASLMPEEFRSLVDGIRIVEKALGSGVKEPFPSELEIAKVARKSLVTKRSLQAGQSIEELDLTAKRPGTGIPALDLSKVIGRVLVRDLDEDVLLSYEDLR
ncbi:MAG: N-acetylneuraminate synthase family protein [Akkermansiaceae bacterium]